MSEDWYDRLPDMRYGLTVQKPVVRDLPCPPGYEEAVPLVDPFEAFIFQTFQRRNADGTLTVALPTDQRHDNSRGVVHGGLLMAFADSVLGIATFDVCPSGTWCVTVSQSSSFLRGVKAGELIEVTPVVTRATRTMIFVRGDFFVGSEMVFQAQSVWKITGR